MLKLDHCALLRQLRDSCVGRVLDLDPEPEQFTVDAGRAPQRIRPAHPSDKLPNLGVNLRATAAAALSAPIVSKPLPMPADNGLRLNDMQGLSPSRADLRYEDPEQSIGLGQRRSGMRMFENGELLAQNQILEGERLPRPEDRSQRSTHNS